MQIPRAKPVSVGEASAGLVEELRRRFADGTLRHVYRDLTPEPIDRAYVADIVAIKSFLERWSADQTFRRELAAYFAGEAEAIALPPELPPLPVAVEALRPLFDPTSADVDPPPAVLRYRGFIAEKLTTRSRIREGADISHRGYRAWRERQMNRCQLELEPSRSQSIVHAPFCIELSKGCSVGCWFCGISAPKLGDLFLYEGDNVALYRGVVETMVEILGPAAGNGFNYWATDPFDNPDYERFMLDFHAITGIFPQTTTALALKDLDRTRRLLALSEEKKGRLNRFSLLSFAQYRRIVGAFSPDELLNVELVLQNREAISIKTNAGRAETEKMRRADRREDGYDGNRLSSGTIACVSGFLISMVDRTVRLVAPCRAGERWPLGYIVFDEGSFEDASEFRRLVSDMIDRHMSSTLPDRGEVALHPDCRCVETDEGLRVEGSHIARVFTGDPVLRRIGECISERPVRLDELVDELCSQRLAEPAEVLFGVQTLRRAGVLAEEPLIGGTAP